MNKRITTFIVTLCLPTILLAAEIEGRIDWAQRLILSTPVSGVVAEVNARPGMQVKQGDVLLQLEQTNFQARVRRARAEANKTRYALEEEERQWDRAQELYERTVTSNRELKVSEIAYQTARANHSSAMAELSMANKALADSVIRAPFDGVIIARHINPAETVVTRLQSIPMLTLGMTGRYHAVAGVDADTAARLTTGMPVQVEVAGQEKRGEIVFVAVEPGTGGASLASSGAAYTIRAEFDTADILQIGTPASIIIP